MASATGIFTISLDFELHWGVHDHRPLAAYARNLLGAREAIPRMLELFERYGVRCTEDCLQPQALDGGLVDVRASRFLRPPSRRLRPLEPLRLHRITAGLSRAAQQGTIYHLWWHPHNFGGDPEYSLGFLERVLEHFRHLAQTHGMRSASMLEIAREWTASERVLPVTPAALSTAIAGRHVAGARALARPSTRALASPAPAAQGLDVAREEPVRG